MIDVRLAPFRMIVGKKLQSGKAGIAKIAQVERGHRIATEPEKSERTAGKAVRHLLAATANLDQIIPIARGLEDPRFFLRRFAGKRIARRIV